MFNKFKSIGWLLWIVIIDFLVDNVRLNDVF